MRFQLFKKHISNINELKGVVQENQSIFQTLKEVDTLYKESIIKTYLEKREQNENEVYPEVNVYDLSKLSFSFLFNRHVLKQGKRSKKKQLKKNKELKFSIKAEPNSKRNVRVTLKHFEEDTIEEVLAHTEEFFSLYLERKRSVWEKIGDFFKKLFKINKKRN